MNKKSHLAMLCVIGALSLTAQALAAEDENALFSDSGSSVIDSSQFMKSQAPSAGSTTTQQTVPVSTVGLHSSGQLSASATTSLGRDNTGEPGLNDLHGTHAPTYSSQMIADLFLDARASDDTKAFASIEGTYLSDSSKTSAVLHELFLDFNIRRHVYFRVGKQVLQWGTCYFWHPSDLVNVDHKAFVQQLGSLDGNYGIRMHVPFGTRANIYGFLDTKGATQPNEIKGTGKLEVLLGTTETSLSLWKKKDMDPVYAGDISSSIKSWSVSAEAAIMPQGFDTLLAIQNDTLFAKPSNIKPRAALSFGRSFDCLNVTNRIHVQYEMYYNGLGYDKNPYADLRNYTWQNGVVLDSALAAKVRTYMPTMSTTVSSGPQALWIFLNGPVSPYSLGRYYAAVFTSISQFIDQDLTLSFNGLMNVTDRSVITTTTLSYSTLQNLTLQIMAITMGGSFPGENTVSYATPIMHGKSIGVQYQGQRLILQAAATYSF